MAAPGSGTPSPTGSVTPYAECMEEHEKPTPVEYETTNETQTPSKEETETNEKNLAKDAGVVPTKLGQLVFKLR